MKKWILLSAFLNLALVAALLLPASRSPEQTTLSEDFSPPTAAVESAGVKGPETRTVVITNQAGAMTWRHVESEDYKTYIANLRAIQCPEQTIREIIMADVGKLYQKRYQPYRKAQKDFQFWQTGNMGWGGNDIPPKVYQETEKEKRQLLKELLGADMDREMARQHGWESSWQTQFYERMGEEMRDRLHSLQIRYQSLESEIHKRSRGYFDEEDQEELKKLQRERRKETAALLGTEAEEFEVRFSNLANEIKWNMEGFNPSEEEFRAIYKARAAAEDGEKRDGSKLDQELKAALGEGRYKEYQLAQDWEFKNLNKIAEREGLGRESAVKVYDMKKEAEEAASKLRRDGTLSKEERDQKLKAIRAETEKAITETIGANGFKSYKRQAWWLRNIAAN